MTGCIKMNDAQVKEALKGLNGWRLEEGKLVCEKQFGDFKQAWAFMGRVAALAEQRQHHPDWSNVYNRVTIRLETHDAGGITAKDCELAEAINAI